MKEENMIKNVGGIEAINTLLQNISAKNYLIFIPVGAAAINGLSLINWRRYSMIKKESAHLLLLVFLKEEIFIGKKYYYLRNIVLFSIFMFSYYFFIVKWFYTKTNKFRNHLPQSLINFGNKQLFWDVNTNNWIRKDLEFP